MKLGRLLVVSHPEEPLVVGERYGPFRVSQPEGPFVVRAW